MKKGERKRHSSKKSIVPFNVFCWKISVAIVTTLSNRKCTITVPSEDSLCVCVWYVFIIIRRNQRNCDTYHLIRRIDRNALFTRDWHSNAVLVAKHVASRFIFSPSLVFVRTAHNIRRKRIWFRRINCAHPCLRARYSSHGTYTDVLYVSICRSQTEIKSDSIVYNAHVLISSSGTNLVNRESACMYIVCESHNLFFNDRRVFFLRIVFDCLCCVIIRAHTNIHTHTLQHILM